MKHLNIHIYGIVQGVGFRYGAREKALALDVSGFARNEADGSVYIEAEGGEVVLQEFVRWCREGPPFAQVERVEIEEDKWRGHQGFRIL